MSSEPVVNSQAVMTEGISRKTLAKFAQHAFKRAAWAAIEWISHCSVVVVILLGMRGIEALVHWLWPGGVLSFLGLMTLDELFSTADFILLCGILVLGIACVVRAYRGIP
jgi:hypothetical protein